ncbi:hypothetical protein ACTXT7_003564 [Hymenolepis weldensis]
MSRLRCLGVMIDIRLGIYVQIDKHTPDPPMDTSWNLTCGWLYKLTELPSKENRFWVDYRYEARFGIPTRRQPVPKHTVSVFFTLRKAYCKPKVSFS